VRRCIVSGRRRRIDDRRAVDDRWGGHRSADKCTGDHAGTNGAPARTATPTAPTGTATPTMTAAPTADAQYAVRGCVL
jgi:hypothetical protein